MSLRNLIFVTMLALPLCINAEEKEKKLRVNYGAKAGFQAIAYNKPVFEIEGYEFDSNILHGNKIGYTIAPFIRLTKNRIYVQTECMFAVARHSFEFKSTGDDDNKIIPNRARYDLRTISLQVPVVVGYNIINEKKYVMSLFTGAKTNFIFTAHSKQEFQHFGDYDLEENLKKRCYYWEIGLGVKIGHVFFDFIYDLGITKASDFIISKSDNRKFRSERRDNILSFSVGVIF